MPAPHRSTLRLGLLAALLAVVPVPALHAQAQAQARDDAADNERFLADCNRRSGDRDRARACDVRELTQAAPGGTLQVDGGQNGGVRVRGWSGSDVKVIARIEAWARSDEAARATLEGIEIRTGSTIRAEGSDNDDDRHWSVSFVVYVPQRSDLALRTNNGGISVENVEGDIALDATNGGLHLVDLAGSVHGETRNGGVNVAVSGPRWRGERLDVRTQNGGVHLELPRDYNAALEIGTVNGGLDIDFPITVQGRINRRITTQLGQGGPLVRVTTVNGGVKVERR